ncbi:MAG TPA: hypothetical protein VMZ28_27095 [Kofleriaceae bacterium]|nr:hypothetical protein [Kofleriaceae bacterium]
MSRTPIAALAAVALFMGASDTASAGLIRKVTRALAKKKQARVLHARGDAYRGTLELAPGNPLGRAAGKVEVTFRGSRATDAPQPKATPLGAALRMPNARGGHEDVLMVSHGPRFLSRLFWPAASFFGKTRYSSLLPHRVNGRKQLFKLVPEDQAARPRARTSGTDLGELADKVASGTASFTLMTEPLRGGDAEIVGRLVIEQRLSDAASRDLKFNPWGNQVLRPAGIINWLVRRAAYRGSQEGRSAR